MNRLRQSWLVFRKQLSYQSIRRFSLQKQKEDDSNYNVILPSEPFVFGTSHIQPRTVPDHIVKPSYARGVLETPLQQDTKKIELGGEAELKIREAALLAKKVREFAGTQVKVRFSKQVSFLFLKKNYIDFCKLQVGTTTNAVDAAIHDFIISHSAYPSPLLYSGFPRSCCTRYVLLVIYLRNER